MPPTAQGHTLTHLTRTRPAPACLDSAGSTDVAHTDLVHVTQAGIGVAYVAQADRVHPEHAGTRVAHVARAGSEHAGAGVTNVALAHRVRAADAGATLHLADSGLGV